MHWNCVFIKTSDDWWSLFVSKTRVSWNTRDLPLQAVFLINSIFSKRSNNIFQLIWYYCYSYWERRLALLILLTKYVVPFTQYLKGRDGARQHNLWCSLLTEPSFHQLASISQHLMSNSRITNTCQPELWQFWHDNVIQIAIHSHIATFSLYRNIIIRAISQV